MTQSTPGEQRVDAYEGNYPNARRIAFIRSKGTCQFCGSEKAEEAHHWALSYPSGDKVKGDDLTAVCKTCHHMVTTFRGLVRAGCDRKQLDADFELALDDRERWQKLLNWVRMSMSRSTGEKEQGSSIQAINNIVELHLQHERLHQHVEMGDLEADMKGRIRRSGRLLLVVIAVVVLQMFFDVPAYLAWLFSTVAWRFG